MFSKNVFCGATSPRLPPGILGLESGGQDPRRGRGAAGRGGGEDGAERRGGAAAGPPGGVCSPTRMNSSGEDGQAVHGSSASPAAAARTVAAPHTGRGSCGLRGAQCACAAPAVTVPPVLMLQPPPGLLPRAPWSRARGLSMSPLPRAPGRGSGKSRLRPRRPVPRGPDADPARRPRPSPRGSRPSRGWIAAAARRAQLLRGRAPRVRSPRRPAGRGVGQGVGDAGRVPRRAARSRRDHSSASPAWSEPRTRLRAEVAPLRRGWAPSGYWPGGGTRGGHRTPRPLPLPLGASAPSSTRGSQRPPRGAPRGWVWRCAGAALPRLRTERGRPRRAGLRAKLLRRGHLCEEPGEGAATHTEGGPAAAAVAADPGRRREPS